MLEIKGFLENSLIEWDGKLSSVIFLPGCNFRCPWCHVPDLAFHPENLETVPFSQVEQTIKHQKGWLDGVVISGGEPTIHPELPAFITELRSLDLPVKIETNGSNPQILRELISNKLIEAVAMDIKNQISNIKNQISKIQGKNSQLLKFQNSKMLDTEEQAPNAKEFASQDSAPKSHAKTAGAKADSKKIKAYDRTAGVKVDLTKIKESIEILMGSSIDYEFRTTVVPAFLNENDIAEIARSISGAKKYVLQQFAPQNAFQPDLKKVKPYSPEKLKAMAEVASGFVQSCQIRGI